MYREEQVLLRNGKSKYYYGTVRTSEGFKEALESVSYKKELILVTTAGSQYLEFLYQLHNQFKRLGMSHFLSLSMKEGSSEYETDSEDDDDGPGFGRRLLKPVFVPKEARETIAERDALEEEEEQLAVNEKARLAERKVETQQLVRERVAQEEAERHGGDPEANKHVESVDTDDEADPVISYENWKQRELRRIRRDREEKEAEAKASEDKERLRNMTDLERAAWDRANPKDKGEEKKKTNFLQKYYHKGAYYQEAPDDARGTAGGDEIYKRDFSAPTGSDVVDKSTLPAVMQVKNFGRSGQTKWKHLAAEDTTAMDDPMVMALKEAQKKRERLAGGAEEFAKPKKF
eukprot:gene13908-19835_t